MAAAKTIEIIGRSTTGSDDAVRQALDEARRTVRNITGVDVVSKGLRGDDLSEWRALVRVAFVHVDNASISRLVVFRSGRWLLRTFNDTTHLEQPVAG